MRQHLPHPGLGRASELGAPGQAGLPADRIVSLLDGLEDGIVVLGPDRRCRYANETAATLLARPRELLLGRPLWPELPAAVGQRFRIACDRAATRGEPTALPDFAGPTERWLESRIVPRGDDLVVVLRDITERRSAETEVGEYADRMAEAERIARFGVWRWEVPTGRVRWSEELHRIYDVAPGAFGGTVDAFVSYLHPDDRDRVWSHIEHALRTLEPFAFRERIIRASGDERVLLSQGRVISGPDGLATALVGVCHDVTDRVEAERARGHSERRLRAVIDNSPSIIGVKDLDGRYLMANAECARVLGATPDELEGRLCTDLFPEIAEQLRENDLQAAALQEAIYDETVLVRDGEPRTYATVTFPLPDAAGRPVETCTIGTDVTERKERESARLERVTWERRIRSALAEDRMLAFAQPVVDLTTGEQVGSELLVRLREGDEVLVPAAFLPAAERYGLIRDIDVWMVGQAVRLAPGLFPEVNLSAITICDPDARREIVALLAAAPAAADRIVFEVTETAAAEHLEAACEFATELTALGCGFALDDFGTGFGSFTYLRQLPLRYLKIDKSFVFDLVSSRDDTRVVQSIIGIAEQFGLRTIAEGVEDAATLSLLRKLGADFAQGFHLGRPAPLDGPQESSPTAR